MKRWEIRFPTFFIYGLLKNSGFAIRKDYQFVSCVLMQVFWFFLLKIENKGEVWDMWYYSVGLDFKIISGGCYEFWFFGS